MPFNLFSLSSVDCFVSMWLCKKKFFPATHPKEYWCKMLYVVPMLQGMY